MKDNLELIIKTFNKLKVRSDVKNLISKELEVISQLYNIDLKSLDKKELTAYEQIIDSSKERLKSLYKLLKKQAITNKDKKLLEELEKIEKEINKSYISVRAKLVKGNYPYYVKSFLVKLITVVLLYIMLFFYINLGLGIIISFKDYILNPIKVIGVIINHKGLSPQVRALIASLYVATVSVVIFLIAKIGKTLYILLKDIITNLEKRK